MLSEKYDFFLKIANTGSITKAADELLISQPALSKYLIRLEESLHAQLFDRSSYPLQLTKAGKIFMQYVLDGIEQEKDCFTQIQGLQDNHVEALRVGVGRWRGSCILPFILPAFQEKYPFIDISIFEGSSDELADTLLKNKTDIAIMAQYNHYQNLRHIPLANEPILLTANNAHPIVKKLFSQYPGHTSSIHVDLKLFQQEMFILPHPYQGLAREIENYFSQIHFVPQRTMLIDNLTTSMYIVSQSSYLTFLPKVAIRAHTPPQNLAFMTIGSPTLQIPIGIAYNPSSPLSHASHLFIEAVSNFLSPSHPHTISM